MADTNGPAVSDSGTALRWHVASALALGCASIALFAIIGAVPRERWPLADVLPFLPMILIGVLIRIQQVRPLEPSADLRRHTAWFTVSYTLLLLAAVALDFFVFDRSSLPAAAVGLLPAVPCFVAASWLARRR